MNIRSLLLGSIAAAGLSTAGYAADLGVVTSLDVCDELGLSGLTISSDDNCLVITGGVSFEYSLGDYEDFDRTGFPGAEWWGWFDRVGFNDDGDIDVPAGDGVFDDSSLDVDAWLKFVATAPSDFGPATATIKLLSEDASYDVVVDEAWVGIGDTTILMAGKKSSIFNDGDDAPLNYLGLYNSSNVDAGVGFTPGNDADTGGTVLQVVSNLGNGLSIGGGLENLGGGGQGTAVGVLAYAGDGITAHVSGAVEMFDAAPDWKLHAGFTGAWDPIKVVGAVALENGGWWNTLGSVSATFDMFTLAASAEATAGGEWGVGGSVSATVSEGVTVNLGGRYFADVSDVYQLEAGVSAAVTETITVTAAVGTQASSAGGIFGGSESYIYGKGGVAWAPGGGFTASVDGYANTYGAYKATFKAAKEIK